MASKQPYAPRYKEPDLPDPLQGLSPYVRQRLLLQRPTWSERWRLCNPQLSSLERRDLVIDILLERRHVYDEQMFLLTKQVELARAHERYRSGELAQTDFSSFSRQALTGTMLHRQQLDKKDWALRRSVQQRRDPNRVKDRER